MAKRKSNTDVEKELLKKFKIQPCVVNMGLFNPALCIYYWTIDVMLELKKLLKPKSIVRIMNGYANSKKRLIPISYIDRHEIKGIILEKDHLTKYTNIEELIRECFPHVVDEEYNQKYIEYVYKRLKKRKFRETDIFNSIKINSEGLFQSLLTFSCKQIDEIVSSDNNELLVQRIKDMKALENVPENNADYSNIFKNCRSQNEFTEWTNIKELARVRIQSLGLPNIDEIKRSALIDILIRNTWKQLNQMDVDKTQPNKLNREHLLETYVLDRMRDLEYDEYDINLINRLKESYRNRDICLIPINYLTNSEIKELFPNLSTIIKFTNILKPCRDSFWSRREEILKRNLYIIECIKKQVAHVYEKLVKDPNFKTVESNQDILINCKFLFNQNITLNEEHFNSDDDIIEYFKKPVPLDVVFNKQVDCKNVFKSNNNVRLKQQNRTRSKLLNQLQAKLNTCNGASEPHITDSEDSSLESNVTVIHCDGNTLGDHQTIIVSEYNSQHKEKLPESNVNINNLDLEMSLIHGLESGSSTTQPYHDCIESIPTQSTAISDPPQPNVLLSNTASPNKLQNEYPLKNNKLSDSENLDTSSVVFVPHQDVITIEDSPTKSQRIAAILQSPEADCSEIFEISYTGVVAKSSNIADMRRQNCKKKISKNPELEIPVMRNTYKPLSVEKKS